MQWLRIRASASHCPCSDTPLSSLLPPHLCSLLSFKGSGPGSFAEHPSRLTFPEPRPTGNIIASIYPLLTYYFRLDTMAVGDPSPPRPGYVRMVRSPDRSGASESKADA